MTVYAPEQQQMEEFDNDELATQPASPKSQAFLRLLISERSDHEPVELPEDQATVSALIDELRTKPALPATEEQLARVANAASAVGIHIDLDRGWDRAQANRVLLDLRGRVRQESWASTQARAKQLASELVGS